MSDIRIQNISTYNDFINFLFSSSNQIITISDSIKEGQVVENYQDNYILQSIFADVVILLIIFIPLTRIYFHESAIVRKLIDFPDTTIPYIIIYICQIIRGINDDHRKVELIFSIIDIVVNNSLINCVDIKIEPSFPIDSEDQIDLERFIKFLRCILNNEKKIVYDNLLANNILHLIYLIFFQYITNIEQCTSIINETCLLIDVISKTTGCIYPTNDDNELPPIDTPCGQFNSKKSPINNLNFII